MSDAIFPELPGLKWDTTKKPKFSTKIHETVSGMETRAAYWSYPRWLFGLSYEVLDASQEVQDLQTLGGFFLARKGSFDSFLFRDSSDCNVVGQVLGTGDGARVSFQLIRSFGEFDEPIKAIDSSDQAPTIYLDGLAQTGGYSISSSGLVTFTAAPGLDVTISADFSFFFRVRFDKDEAEFSQFMADLWELKKCDLYGLKGEDD